MMLLVLFMCVSTAISVEAEVIIKNKVKLIKAGDPVVLECNELPPYWGIETDIIGQSRPKHKTVANCTNCPSSTCETFGERFTATCSREMSELHIKSAQTNEIEVTCSKYGRVDLRVGIYDAAHLYSEDKKPFALDKTNYTLVCDFEPYGYMYWYNEQAETMMVFTRECEVDYSNYNTTKFDITCNKEQKKGKLRIMDVSIKEDGTVFGCYNGGKRYLFKLTVNVPVTSVSIQPQNRVFIENENGTFICEVEESKPEASFQWIIHYKNGSSEEIKGGSTIRKKPEGKHWQTNSTLIVELKRDYQKIMCKATIENLPWIGSEYQDIKFVPIRILRLTAVKDSKYRYHFTCYTNSTLEDLKYEWYWNAIQVFRGSSCSMRNGKSQGTIVFDGLNEKDSGNLTCRVNYRATKSKLITMKYFPVVELNTTSHIIKNRNPVKVACHLFPTNRPSKPKPKLCFKVNNREINASTVTLSKDATVSCYGVNDVGQGEIKTLRISVATGKKFCPPMIYKNITWPETTENTTVNVPCSKDFSGTVSRFCSINVKWEEPDNSRCVKNSILEAKAELHRTEIIGGNFASAVEQLANSTKGHMGAKDIDESIASLDIVSRIANNRTGVSRKEVTGFVEVVNNLAGSNRKSAWEKLADENQLTPASILKRTEDFGNIAARRINKTIVIPTENLVLKFQKVDVDKDINFSVPIDNNKSAWARKERVFIPSNILKDNFGANETVAMSAVIFRNMKDLLPKSKNTSGIVNSYIVTVSLGKRLLNLSENIMLSFSHLSTGLEQSCNFWEFGKDPELVGDWSTRGCEVNTTNSNYTVCSCDHLTSFAILMKPEAMHMTKRNEKVLDIITKVGCSISIVALVVTIIMYGILWKYLTSQDVARSQSILLMNMCVPLIIAYLLFLTLVEETQEKIGCIVIAALIHYFLLVSFFTMLAEGVDMAITLTVVFTSRVPRLPWLLVLGWVGPAIIVGISLAITKKTGFVDHKYCWLALENNVRWAFIAPVLIIILANIICVVLIVKALLSSHRMIHESVKQRLRTGARAIGILTPLLGFTWLFGVFAVGENLVFDYIFTAVNSLQGLFIFLAYCVFNKQIRKHLCKREKRTSCTPARVIHNDEYSNTPRNSGTKVTELTNSSNKYSLNDD